MSDYVCYWTGCVLDATTRCATCDGWFCREHDDHGPLGDGPHGGGKPTYADLEREVERLGELYESTDLALAQTSTEGRALRAQVARLETAGSAVLKHCGPHVQTPWIKPEIPRVEWEALRAALTASAAPDAPPEPEGDDS